MDKPSGLSFDLMEPPPTIQFSFDHRTNNNNLKCFDEMDFFAEKKVEGGDESTNSDDSEGLRMNMVGVIGSSSSILDDVNVNVRRLVCVFCSD